jgi:hypothetical protein
MNRSQEAGSRARLALVMVAAIPVVTWAGGIRLGELSFVQTRRTVLERVRSAGPVSPCPGVARRDRISGDPPEASVKNLLVHRGPLTFSETDSRPGRRG